MNRRYRHEIIHLQEFFGVDEIQRARVPEGRGLNIGLGMGTGKGFLPSRKESTVGTRSLSGCGVGLEE
jgi:hypothetical protein